MSEVIIAEATGYAGGNNGPAGPLVELAMAQAIVDANRLGITDDTPNERLAEIIGADAMAQVFGDTASTAIGADYIRSMKLGARDETLAKHRGLIKAHEGAKAAELHAARK